MASLPSSEPTLPDQSTTANPRPTVPLPTSLPGPDPPTLSVIYAQLTSYPFHTDADFLSGLAAILGHPSVPATPEELRSNPDLVLQARCFYLSRRFNIDPPIQPAKYLEWSKDKAATASEGGNVQGPAFGETGREDAQPLPSATTTAPTSAPAPSSPPTNEPTYPPSFAAIVDLITNNLPIPGIEEIPPTILEPGTSKIDHTPRRKKPWEKDETSTSNPEGGDEARAAEGREGKDGEEAEGDGGVKDGKVNGKGNAIPGEGVVKILQPNAIPPSGLLSAD